MRFAHCPLEPSATFAARLWACCMVGASAGLWSCGGRATDGGMELEGSAPDVAIPFEEPASFVTPVRETCDDNPLLAECPSGSTGASSPTSAVERETIPEEPLYIAAARNVLMSHCAACHSSVLSESQASANINYIDDWQRLIEAGLIQECSPPRSRIIQVMRTREMPPPQSGWSPVPEAEIEFVVQAIELDCTDR
jgi:hypothetical protein